MMREQTNMHLSYDHPLNIVVLGDAQVGKTTLLEEYCRSRLKGEPVEKTIGYTLHCKKVAAANRVVTGVFHDFSGESDYLESMQLFLKIQILHGAENGPYFPFDAVFVVFDCQAKHSLRSINSWLEWFQSRAKSSYYQLEKKTQEKLPEFCTKLDQLPVVILGNKIDLFETMPAICTERFMSTVSDPQTLKMLEFVSNGLRSQLTLEDQDNLVFTSSELIQYTEEILNPIISSLYTRTMDGRERVELGTCKYTLSRCLLYSGSREFFSSPSGLYNYIRSFFTKSDIALPL
jgi:GTPase SAR1 family protein